MKTYEEKAERVLNKIEEEKKARKKLKKAIVRTAVPAVCLCIAAILCIGGVNKGLMNNTPVIPVNEVIASPSVTEAAKPVNDPVNKTEKTDAPEPTSTPAIQATSAPITVPVETSVPEDPFIEGIPQVPEDSDPEPGSAIDIPYLIGMDGKYYEEEYFDTEYSAGVYLGRAADYEGYFKENAVDGELYQSAEDETVLLVFSDNGDTLMLKEK